MIPLIGVRYYGVMIALGVLAAVTLARQRWKAMGNDPDEIADVAVWAVPAGLIGARLYHVITDWNDVYSNGRWMWRAFEIWTGNRIYGLNRDMICIEVLNRPTNTLDAQHPLLGAKLVCGQRQYRNSVHVAYPLPVPGTTAAFLRTMPPNMPKGRSIPASVTSKVERVILRVLVSSVPLSENAADEVTSAFLKF